MGTFVLYTTFLESIDMYLKRSATIKYILAGCLGAVLYCEWFVYFIQPLFWKTIECNEQDLTCMKILFIADPQIQGDNEVSPPLSYLFNWDSDRYLKSTFLVALRYFKPHVLVYLGDLMDEGSISTQKQFHTYVKRLLNIFEVDYPIVQIWLPGDNDIGGENEPVRRDKLNEFNKVFEQPSVIEFENVTFYKVNGMTHTYPYSSLETNEQRFKIVVSHYPVTHRQVFGLQVNNNIKPNIYFCAHSHDSKYVEQNKDLQNRRTHYLKYGADLNIKFPGQHLYEIYVPTCSYRMGTDNIGYGAAILGNGGRNLRYTVLWSTTRFPYLFFYLTIFTLLILYIIIYCVVRILFCHTPRLLKAKQDYSL